MSVLSDAIEFLREAEFPLDYMEAYFRTTRADHPLCLLHYGPPPWLSEELVALIRAHTESMRYAVNSLWYERTDWAPGRGARPLPTAVWGTPGLDLLRALWERKRKKLLMVLEEICNEVG